MGAIAVGKKSKLTFLMPAIFAILLCDNGGKTMNLNVRERGKEEEKHRFSPARRWMKFFEKIFSCRLGSKVKEI